MLSSHVTFCVFVIGETCLKETIDRLREETPLVSGAPVRNTKGRFSKAADVRDPNLHIFYPLRDKLVYGLSMTEKRRFRRKKIHVQDYILKAVKGTKLWNEMGEGVHYLDVGNDSSDTDTIEGKLAFALKDCWQPIQNALLAAYKERHLDPCLTLYYS